MASYLVEVKWKSPNSGSTTHSSTFHVEASSPSEAERKAKEKIRFEHEDATSILVHVF